MAVKQDGASSDRPLRNYLAVLEDEHRRAVVRVLAEEDASVSLSILAERVAVEAGNASFDAPTPSELERLKIKLHHAHLPKLDEAGVLDYSPEARLAVPTDETDSAQRAAETLIDA
ncbi:DUF7344 domain-containing protein [Halopelagius longus]|uniref:DUF7344 domain-containing protein n=1 Tax=Halopelagius longus TaxID=1236180 RepID=A0A1H1C8A8_9EURY|nr:hypothetical protein [Halopelagius longus]RDI71117.1 hypothetical protein DWB78_04875 [Halopelagius longus]SDQ60402.1 hypothetical protein SAMN05216278_2166 [Halopelagius longus]